MNNDTFIAKLNENCQHKKRAERWKVEDVGSRYYCYSDECGHECCNVCREIFDEYRRQKLISYLTSKNIRLCKSCFLDFYHKSRSGFYENLSLTLFEGKNMLSHLKNADYLCTNCLIRLESTLLNQRLDRIERKIGQKTK